MLGFKKPHSMAGGSVVELLLNMHTIVGSISSNLKHYEGKKEREKERETNKEGKKKKSGRGRRREERKN